MVASFTVVSTFISIALFISIVYFHLVSALHTKSYRSRQKWSNANKSKLPILDKVASTMAEGRSINNSVILVHPTKPAEEAVPIEAECHHATMMLKAQPLSSQIGTRNLKIFTFDELQRATRNFRPSAMIGFSDGESVYKGWVDRESYAPSVFGIGIAVAIKILNTDKVQSLKEWQAEVNFLGKFSHPNLVKLLGYCQEKEKLLLVYEYMQKGSLENHLFRRGKLPKLPWDTRIKIAMGVAQGLVFLHATERRVIFRDVKPSNILLDGEYNAKLSDFGLALLGPTDGESHVTTAVIGTYGYAAPEYVATGHLYIKSDVYGFGVVLLEMITGLRVLDSNRPGPQQNLVEWATPSLTNRKKLQTFMDARMEQGYPKKGAIKAARLIRKCLLPDPNQRPSMEEVLTSLEEISAIKM